MPETATDTAERPKPAEPPSLSQVPPAPVPEAVAAPTPLPPRRRSRPPGETASHRSKPATALLTRDELVEFLREEEGIPISHSTMDKLCAQNKGPEPERWWGRRPLYTRERGRAWVEARSRRSKR